MYSASIWEKESFFAPRDIIIVGSGLAGLWCAWYLKKKNPEISITIVDRGIIPTGASTRNAGFACFGSVSELIEDAHKMGEDNMLEITEMRFRGLERIRKTFKNKTIDLDFCGGYELITETHNISVKELQEQIEWLNQKLSKPFKVSSIYKFSDKKIKSFGFKHVQHLIQNKLEGYLHSGKLCQALLQKLQAKGVTVLNAIEINGFEKMGDQMVLYTNQHIHLKARQLLICTNAFAKQLLPELQIEPARGQVLVTSEIPSLPFKGTFHYDGGYYYFRNLGKRVLLGGARNKYLVEEATAEMITTENVQRELEHFLSYYLLPNTTYQITDRWSGIMGMGPEKLPIVKKISENVFCAVRMSGMGVALTPVIGEKIAKMMLKA